MTSASFTQDGEFAVVTGDDNTARVLRLSDGQVVAELRGHTKPLRGASFSPDGKLVVTAGDDNAARVWDWRANRVVLELPHPLAVSGARFSPDGAAVITTSDDNVGTRNAPVAYGRPYEGTHPRRAAGKHPLGHGPRPAGGTGTVDAAAPNGNAPYTVKCWRPRMPCGSGRGLLACLSRVTGRGARVSGWWSAHRRTTSPQVASPRVAVH